jgi:hypothetical protein
MATAPVYLDSEEEIPEVIERLRSSAGSEVPLVVPARSRLGQSRFNFQLLQHYASQHGKKIAIISPDPSVMRMAEETGLPAFGAIEQYGPAPVPAVQASRARPVVSTRQPEPTRLQPERPIPAPPRPVPPPSRPAPAARPLPVDRTRLAPARPPATSSWTPGLPERIGSLAGWGSKPAPILLYAGAALVLLVGLLAMVLFLPSASVRIVAAAEPAAWEGDIQAEPGRPPIHVRLASLEKQVSESFKTTGTKVTPAVPATGSVVWSNRCDHASFTVPKGQRVNGGGAQFAVGSELTVSGGESESAAVTATSGGGKGNVGANTITSIEGATPDVTLCLSVSNPAPTSGGVDEKREGQLSQADWDKARAQLQQELGSQISSDLAGKANKGERLSDKVSFQPADFTADHRPGDVVSNFNASMTLKGEGAYYSADDVRQAIATNLQRHVRPGYTVTDNGINSDYQVADAAPGGRLTFHAKGNAYVAPKLDNERVKSTMVRRSPAQAKAEVMRTQPLRSVEIDQRPFALPWMPLFSSRIELHYVVEQGTVERSA